MSNLNHSGGTDTVTDGTAPGSAAIRTSKEMLLRASRSIATSVAYGID
ncbi:MAG: hypothetical protein M3Y32_14250 [Pseudomonadota bacterium]|nr:hypothetical protein [Pseudomonadota bacterium]